MFSPAGLNWGRNKRREERRIEKEAARFEEQRQEEIRRTEHPTEIERLEDYIHALESTVEALSHRVTQLEEKS